MHVHHHQDAQVVAGCYRAVQQSQHGQPDQVRFQGGLEDIEFAEEPAGEGNADQREQEDREHCRGERLLAAQAGEVVDILIPFRLPGDVGHGGERPDVHQRVGGQVEHGGGGARFAARGERHQHVTRVRDGAVGQHALDVGLQQGGEVPDRHGKQRGQPYHGRPPAANGLKGRHEDAQEYREGGGFGAGR